MSIRLAAAALLAPLLLTCLVAPRVTPAAVFLETSVESVARASDAVVRGQVVSRSSFFTQDRRTILTEVVVEVAEAWKGTPGERVRVIVPGGRVGDLAQRVDAAPGFADGEEVVVFLSRRGDFFELNGLAIGKFRVEGGEAVPELGNILFQGPAVKAGERRVGAMPFEELRRRVAGAGVER